MSDNNKSKSNNKQLIPYIFAIIILLFIIIFSTIQLIGIFSEYYAGDSEYKELSERYISKETESNDKDKVEDIERLFIDFPALSNANSDLIGWIHFENIDISYPIVQTDNNDYYINHTFGKEENNAGAIFLDYRNHASFNDRNTYLYGHNMKNNTMFGLILNYVDKEYYEDNPYFWVYTPEARYKYEIFTVFEEDSSGPAYQISFENDIEFGEFLNLIDKRKYYDTGVQVSSSDNILALSTCTKDDRFLVFGKKVDKEYY